MANAQPERFPTSAASPLTGTLADPSGGQIQAANQFRRYRAGVFGSVLEHGSPTHKARSIFYEVGRRYNTGGEALAPPPEAAIPLDCSIDINPSEAASFEGLARRYSNFSPQWVKMDLAGMVERLARGVAVSTVYGDTNATALRGGRPVRIVALGTLDSPQTASISSVFIPRTVDTVGNDAVFAVLAAAANGCGASVTTDVLRLDANTNQPIVPNVAGSAFVGACVEALRVLGANMEASGGGDIFAYAVTRGIHSVVSVVSHTDEGGFMRNLLREDTFRVPYGGVNQALRHYPALPALAATSPSAQAAWVDAIALKTAAAVAHCDPLVPGRGGWYPSVFTAARGTLEPPGTAEDGVTDADARSIGGQIANDLGRFAPLYMRALTHLFGLTSNSGIAESHFCTAGAKALAQTGAVDRHLLHKTVAPYFWVEPTSLLSVNEFGTLAEAEGFGAKVSVGHEQAYSCFESFRLLEKGSTANNVTVAFKMRTARTSALVSLMAAEPAPLNEIRLYQFDESSVTLPGDQGPTAGTVAAKHANADPISSYLWTRGQSCFPAPAEFINTQGTYGAKVSLVSWDDDWNATLPDLPNDIEMASGRVTFRVTVPTGIPMGATNAADRQAKRARSRAAVALSQAIVRSRAFGLAVSPAMEVSDVPPDLGEEGSPFRDTEPANTRGSGAINTRRAEGTNTRTVGVVRGAPLPPIATHEPQRAPRLPPQNAPGGGGPGGPPPPMGPPPPAGPPPAGPPPPDDMPRDPTGAPLDPLPVHPIAALDNLAGQAEPAPQV